VSALAVLARVVALLAWSSLDRAGAVLGWLAGSVLRIRRGAVEGAMTRAAVNDAPAEAAAMYRGLGEGVFELLWLASVSAERRADALRTHVRLDDDLERALIGAADRGPVILAASHTGNWELIAYGAAQVLAKHGRRLAVVVKPQSVGAFHAFCMHLREACGLVLIAPQGAFAAARRSLAAGDVIAMPIDQVPERRRHGIEVSFLGAAALADRAPAALACLTGATLLVVAASRDGRLQRGHLLAELLAHAPRTTPETAAPVREVVTASAWIENATREATRALEAFVRKRPSSWLWLHRRWRAPLELQARSEKRATSGPLVVTGHPG
jgi:lauroyl/myristoyl acyltransferase